MNDSRKTKVLVLARDAFVRTNRRAVDAVGSPSSNPVSPDTTMSTWHRVCDVNVLQQLRVKGGQIIRDILDPGTVQLTRGLLQSSGVVSKSIWLTSAVTSMRTTWPNSERRRDLMADESGGCLVIKQRTSTFLRKSYQWIWTIRHGHSDWRW